MKFVWKGKWRKGEITIEAESFEELDAALNALPLNEDDDENSRINNQAIPQISRVKGVANVIRTLMDTDWGETPRLMIQIQEAAEGNGLYFSKGTLSGTLTAMVKKGQLRRLKEGGRWKYLRR